MAKLTKSEPKSRLQKIADVSPRYSALLSRHTELTARYEEIIEEANGPKGRVDGTVDGKTGAVRYHTVPLAEQQRRSQIIWTAQLPKPVVKPVVRHSGAVALLGDLLPEQPPEELAPQPLPPSWNGQDRLAALGAEAEAIQAALKLIAPEITKERKQYSRLVAAQRSEEYKAIVERITDISKGLGDAIQAHHEFIDAQRLDGVAYSTYRPLNLSAFGNISEQHTPLLQLIVDAVEKGHVGAGKLPNWVMPIDIQHLQGGE